MKAIRAEDEWISQAEAARPLGVSRQAVFNAISTKRLATTDRSGRTMLCRTEVLALKVRPGRARAKAVRTSLWEEERQGKQSELGGSESTNR